MKCKYCGFPVGNARTCMGINCECLRCTAVRASGFCNDYHRDAYKEDKEFMLGHFE